MNVKTNNNLGFVIFLLLYEISVYIANDMIMPGMLDVVHTFSVGEQNIPAALTAFILGGCSLQIILGPLSDAYGRRPVMMAGVFIFFITTLLLAFSGSYHHFIILRFFQGMGLCFISVIGYSTLHELFDAQKAVHVISIMNNLTILAPLAGPLLGVAVLYFFPWQYIFLSISCIALVTLVGLYLMMPETVNKQPLSEENKTARAQLNIVKKNYIALIHNKGFMLGAFTLGLSSIPLIAWIGTSPIMLMKFAHLSMWQYGLIQLPIFLSVSLGNFWMRHKIKVWNLMQVFSAGSLILILSLFSMALFSYFTQHYILIIIGLSLYGFGLGVAGGPLSRLVLYSTPISKGTASAVISLVSMCLTAFGNQLAGLLYIYKPQHNLSFIWFCASCALIYALFFFLIKDNLLHSESTTA